MELSIDKPASVETKVICGTDVKKRNRFASLCGYVLITNFKLSEIMICYS